MSKRIVSFTACCIFFLVFCLSGCSHTSETTENTHPVETTDTTQTLTTETPETPETTYDSSEIVTSVPQRNYYKTLIHNGDEYTFYIYENEYASFSVLSDIVTDKEELIIPAEVEGIRISKISYTALSSLTTVKKLVLSEGIEQLEPNFPIPLCETLEELYLPASLQIIGSGYENAEDFQGNGLFAGKGIYVVLICLFRFIRSEFDFAGRASCNKRACSYLLFIRPKASYSRFRYPNRQGIVAGIFNRNHSFPG